MRASPEAVYRAYLDPEAVAIWLPPDSMTGVVHAFEAREGGAFSMSLLYPEAEAGLGKTSAAADMFRGRFAKLVPNREVVWAVEFKSDDPSFDGEMLVRTELRPVPAGVEVTIVSENIPAGIRLEDNEAGCRSTLEKLAAFVEG